MHPLFNHLRHRFVRDEARQEGDHEHRDHRRHRHERGGRRSSRVFDHGDLRLVMLALIAERPRHGYDLIKAIEDRLAGTYSPSPGVIYPTLTLLEEIGQATVSEQDGKKLYAITDEGKTWLAANQPALDGILARIEGIKEAHGGGQALQITRAVENLKMAMRLRQSTGPLTTEQIQKIAEILDAAATAIERT